MPHKLFESAKEQFERGEYIEAQKDACKAFSIVKNTIRPIKNSKFVRFRVTLIVVVWRLNHEIFEALDKLSIIANELDDFELLFVSNGAFKLDKELALKFENYTLVELDYNFGCCFARNIGASHAKGDILVFLDDDGYTDISSLQILVGVLLDNPNAIAVRGSALPKDGRAPPEHYRPSLRRGNYFINLEGMSTHSL